MSRVKASQIQIQTTPQLCLLLILHTRLNPVFVLVCHSLINADFCCAGCLIAYGALLGKVSPVQLMVVTLFGITLFAVEEFIILSLLHVSVGTRGCSSK